MEAQVYISSSHCSITTILFISGCLYVQTAAQASPSTNLKSSVYSHNQRVNLIKENHNNSDKINYAEVNSV